MDPFIASKPEEVIPFVNDLDIIATRTKGFTSWWIRKSTDSQVSHVFVAGGMSVWGRSAYSQDWRYRRVLLLDYLQDKTGVYVYRYPGLRGKQIHEGLAYCNSRLGMRYPLGDIFQRWAVNLIKPGTKKLSQKNDYQICSENVAHVYLAMGITLNPEERKHPSAYTPQDIIEDGSLQLIAQYEGG